MSFYASEPGLRKINKFYGVNESASGDTNLKPGEAADSYNWETTRDNAITIRPGTINIASLLNGYSVATGGSTQVVRTDTGEPTTFTVYPSANVSGNGLINLYGTTATLNYANRASYVNYYWPDGSGNTYKFASCTYTASTGAGTHVTGGTVSLGDAAETGVAAVPSSYPTYVATPFYSAVKVVNGSVEYDGTSAVKGYDDRDISTYKYYKFGNTMYEMTSATAYSMPRYDYINGQWVTSVYYYIQWTGKIVTATGNDTYAWSFYPMTIVPTATAAPVQGIWSGRVGDSEYIVAACDGKMWSLSYNEMPNMIKNSTYANGTDEWSNETSNYSTASGVMTFTATSQYGLISQHTPTIVKGHKYYYRALVQASSSSVGLIAADYIAIAHTSDYHTGSGAYELLSDVFTIPSNATESDFFFGVRDERASGWDAVKVKDFVLIDITNAFGPGTEPIQSWGDTYLEYNGDKIIITDATVSTWIKSEIGSIDTTNTVNFFGFRDNLYIHNGITYHSWDGITFAEVAGYIPLTAIGCDPDTGSGTNLQNKNRLTGKDRRQYTNTAGKTVFRIPETNVTSIDYVKNMATGVNYTLTTDYTKDATAGTVTFGVAPAATPNLVEIGWTSAANARTSIEAMRFSETYSGATNAYVFLYGDGSNIAYYSGLEYESQLPSAEYFPTYYFVDYENDNDPITAMIRHHDQLVVFKKSGAFYSTYNETTLSDGTLTFKFDTLNINRGKGNEALGQVRIVKNNPLTLFGKSIYEWSVITRNEERAGNVISERVAETLKTFDFANTITFDDEYNSTYYACYDGTCVVLHYYENQTLWDIYTDVPATCFASLNGELYYGTDDGFIRHFSHSYFSDCGEAIDAYWEGGADDMGLPKKLKTTNNVFVSVKNDANTSVYVSLISKGVQTDPKEITALGTDGRAIKKHLKIKAKQYDYSKLVFESDSADTTATVIDAAIEYMPIKDVK